MNFTSIQINLHDIVILQLISWQNNVIALNFFIFLNILYLYFNFLILIYSCIIINFIKFNLYHVNTCQHISKAQTQIYVVR